MSDRYSSTNATIFSWSYLWRFSHSQIITYASYATLLIPLIAQFVLFLHDFPINISTNEITPIPAWRIFAGDIYFSGLLLVIGRLLVQLGCPQRIQRFPYEDDHFIFIAKIKEEIKKIDADSTDPQKLDHPVNQILEKVFKPLLKRTLDSSESTNDAWKTDNAWATPLRWFIGILYTVGTLGIVVFLIWRAVYNGGHVLQLLTSHSLMNC